MGASANDMIRIGPVLAAGQAELQARSTEHLIWLTRMLAALTLALIGATIALAAAQ